MSMGSDWIETIFTSISGIVSIAAAFTAAKSASAAKASADVAAKALRRSAIRELLTGCHELILEDQRIESLVTDLRIEFISMSQVPDVNSSNPLSALETDRAKAKEESKEAYFLVKDQAKLILSTDDDLILMQGRIEAAKTNLLLIRESMASQLKNLRDQKQVMLLKL